MANKKIELKFDFDSKDVEIVSDKVLTLTEQIRILKKELQKTEEGTESFDILKNKLNDTQDDLERVNAKSREFFGTLQLIPGPIGEIASKINGAISLMKTFSGFTFKDIKASVAALVKDFGDIASNIGRVTGITKIYTIVNQALSKSFVAVGVGEAAATAGARAFAAALTATGIGALVVLIGTAVSALMSYANAAEDAAKKQQELNDAQDRMAKETLDVELGFVKRITELDKAKAKARGASNEELYKLDKQGLELRLASQKRYFKDLSNEYGEDGRKATQTIKDTENDIKVLEANYQAEQLKERQQAAEKSSQLAKQSAQKREQIEKELQNKVKQYVKEGYESKEKTREVELENAKKQFQELEAELKKNKKSTVEITTAYNLIIEKINKDYDDKDLKRQQEKDTAIVELEASRVAKSKNNVEDLKKVTELAYQDEIKNFKGSAEEKELIRLKYVKIVEDGEKAIRDRRVKGLQLELEQTNGNATEQIRITAQLQEELKNTEGLSANERFQTQKGYQDNLLQLLDTSYSNQKATIETNYDEFKRFDTQYYDDQRVALEKYATDLKSAYDKGTITKEQFTQRDKQLAQARKDINKQEVASNQEKTKLIGDALGQLSTIIGQDTTAGKAFAIAKATIDTYQSAVAAYKSLAGIPVIGPALGAIAAAAAVASGIATVKKIVAVQIPSAPANTGGNATQTTPAGPGERPIVSANATAPVGKAQGGLVRGPGGAFSDSIPAMLSDGEFVVNSRSSRIFQPLLQSINDAGNLPGFAVGGVVSKQSRPQQDNTETLINAIQESFGTTPIRTYVTAADISNQQQFDRVIKSRSLI